jgi:hypothetical protein
MRSTSIYRVVAWLFIGILLLTSCKSASSITSTSPSATPIDSPFSTNSDTGAVEGEPTEEAATPTPNQPTPTPIVETRLPPERWQEWPVIPELTGLEKAIYQQGLAMGNDPHSFSKVGDCQAIKSVLMGIYDQPGRYILAASDAHLQETIDYFAGSFNRDGQAVRGGYNAAAVLSPIWADPEVCQPGENPIECENRIHNPSFVIISLERWWEGRTVERYEEYMRTIIDYFLDNNVVPILSTKADNVEGDHRINLATARLAYEYHLPLWNFWLAVQPMPNHGIDPNRDGFHISYDAWTVRSYTALEALDAVWRGVRDEVPSEQAPTATQTPEVIFADISMSPMPAEGTIPMNNQRLVFSLEQRNGEATQSPGIFAFDISEQTLYQVLGMGYRLQDIDANGTRLLVSQGNQLFIADPEGNATLVTDKLAVTGWNASAFWMPDDTQIEVLTDEPEGRAISLVDPATNAWQSVAAGTISGLIKPADNTTFYWYSGECPAEAACEDNTVWRTANGKSELFAEEPNIAVTGDGQNYAWVISSEEPTLILYTNSVDQTNQNFLYLPGNRAVDLQWSPLNDQLALLTVTRSDYTGKSTDARIFVVTNSNMSHLEYYAFPGLNPAVAWSADTGQLLLTSTLPVDDGYQLYFRKMNLSSGLFDDLDDTLSIISADFITIEKLFWIFPNP